MNNQMMAAVLYGKEHLQVEPVAVPTIDSGDILVRVKVALTCGTDVKVFRRGYHARMIVPPAVFGHELAGDVVAVGEDVTQFSVGPARGGRQFGALRAIVSSAAAVLQNLCEDLLFNNGAYAEYIRIPARIVERNTYRDSRRTSAIRTPPDRAAGLRAARTRRRPRRAGRYHRHHRPGTHRPDVREAGEAVRLPRDRHRPAQDATGSRRAAGRRRADRRPSRSRQSGRRPSAT